MSVSAMPALLQEAAFAEYALGSSSGKAHV